MRPSKGYMAKKDIPTLQAFAAAMEAKAQPLAVTQITHPDAVDGGVYEGVYAGIRLVKGDAVAAVFADGSKH